MKFNVKITTPEEQAVACAVVGIFDSRKLEGLAQRIDKASDGLISERLRSRDISRDVSKVSVFHDVPGLACERLMVVGCGSKAKFDRTRFRRVCGTVARHLKALNCNAAALWLTDLPVPSLDPTGQTRQLVEVMEDAWYRYSETKSKPASRLRLRRVVLSVLDTQQADPVRLGVAQGRALSTGKQFAKDLANLPGNICTPSYLADRARELAKTYDIKTTIVEQKEMEKLGMGALLSVSRGSRQPPKLIVMEYKHGKKNDAPIALVGKGLTFDAGGISLKPAANMDEMKYDMCGGASVFGALVAAAEMKLPLNIVGVVPSSENLPDGDANKPGDIVTSMAGKTIEVLNTDAEGRLILCDALTYVGRYEPDIVIDIATLTGACVIALGSAASGLMANDDELAEEILTAGEHSGDRAWRLPLWREYQSQLDSNFADMANIGGRNAGAITAGCFLSRYTGDYRWAHLDIAGTAWRTGRNKGASGRAVPLLTQLLLNRCAVDEHAED